MCGDSLWTASNPAVDCFWRRFRFSVFAVTKELYDRLDYKEKMIYDEFCHFTKVLTEQLTVMTAVMQKLLDVATHDLE